jgi:hypothetical protein
MGQTLACPVPGVVPTTKELSWKTGKKADVVPNTLASHLSSFDSLHVSSEFKDSFLLSFHSSYLISAVLSDSCSNDAILLGSIQNYQTLDTEYQNKILSQVDSFRDINSSGIAVKLSEALDVAEKRISCQKNLVSSPFLRVFQKRLVALQGLKDCIHHERILAQEKRKPREYSSVPSLNSDQFPQLVPLTILLETGLSYFRLFPLLIHAEGLNEHTEQLLDPLAKFEKDLSGISSLALFKTWSPKPFPPMRSLALDKGSASASVGNAADVFEKPSTGWCGSKTSCSWSINVTSTEIISFITIQWASAGSPTIIGAPKCATISYRPLDLNINSPTKYLAGYEVFGMVYPDIEYRKQNSWTQVYPVRIQGPVTIHLLVSKTAAANNASNGVRIFGFTAGNENSQMRCSNPLPLLHSIQESLVPIGNIGVAASYICKSMIWLPFTSGSLSLSLRLFNYMFFLRYESKLKEYCSSEFCGLLSAIYNEERAILSADTKIASDKLRDDVWFDDKCKSSDCILTEGQMVASFASSGAYVMSNYAMETGIWTWEISIVQDNSGDETACLGIARRPLSTSAYDSNPNTWIVRCYNGELYHNGRVGNRSIAVIHPRDVCRFSFDCQAQTLSLTVNENEYGVIFEDVPIDVYIFASFYSSNKSVRLMSVRHRSLTLDSSSTTGSRKLSPDFEKLCPTDDGLVEEISWSALLLERLGTLARSRCSHLPAAKPCGLEYPHSVEVSIEVFDYLVCMLHRMQDRLEDASFSDSRVVDSRIVTALLEILDVHFQCLSASKVDVAEIGFKYERKSVEISQKSVGSDQSVTEVVLEDFIFEPGRPATVISRCHDILSKLRNAHSPIVRLHAATATARGSILLFPNMVDKLKLVVSTFDSVFADNNGDVNKANMALLASLLSQIHDVSEISQLLNQHKSGSVTMELLFAVVDRLLAVSSMEPFTSVHSQDSFPYLHETGLNAAQLLGKETNIRAEAVKILSKFQQHVVYEYIVCRPKYGETFGTRIRILFERYCDAVLLACSSLCQLGMINMSGATDSEHYQTEKYIEDSPLLRIVFPLLHAFCYCTDDEETVRKLLPKTVHFFSVVTALVKESKFCSYAEAGLHKCIPRRLPAAESGQEKSGGWRRVKTAAFESGEMSYTVTEEGTMYTSNHSSNTCALVAVDSVTKYTKLAWEFELASDSVNDQCSVFGCSRKNPTSRCYSSSPDLWMRRAYNGYMYSNGSTVGAPMDKIQPGDTIRVEHDMKAGTISFSINGGSLQVGFSSVHEPVFPACGSYRTGVQIRLLKVETFGSVLSDKLFEVCSARSPDQGRFFSADSEADEVGDTAVLMHPKIKGAKTNDKDSEPTKLKWLTKRSDVGAVHGIGEWSFEIIECARSPFAIGAVFGGEPYPHDFLGGPCLESKSDEEGFLPHPAATAASLNSTTLQVPSTLAGNHAALTVTVSDIAVAGSDVAVVSIIPEEEHSRRLNSSRAHNDYNSSRSDSGGRMNDAHSGVASRSDASALFTAEESADVCSVFSATDLSPHELRNAKFSYGVSKVHALSWHSDGSLWIDGDKVSSNFGKKFLPIEKLSSIAVRINRVEGTISFYVNGQFAGIAFGGAGSGACVVFELPTCSPDVAQGVIYPAASVSSNSLSIRLRPTGVFGPTVVPLSYLVQKVCSSVIGRLSGILLSGPALDKKEAQLLTWLQSPLLIGGMDQVVDKSKEDNIVLTFLSRLSAVADRFPLYAEGALMVEWYETAISEPAGLRKNLESKGSYRFLQCELPFLAALMKHGGLVAEAMRVINELIVCQPAVVSGVVDADQLVPASDLARYYPSPDMLALWTRVKQLRVQLRKERQIFNTKNPDLGITGSFLTPHTALVTTPHLPITATSVQPDPALLDIVGNDDSQFDILSTAWVLPPAGSSSRFSDVCYCDVLAVGYDFANERLLIRFHSVCNETLVGLQEPRTSRVLLSPERIIHCENSLYVRDNPSDYLGVLSFRVVPSDAPETICFEYGSSGYQSVAITLPRRDDIGNNVVFAVRDLDTVGPDSSVGQSLASAVATPSLAPLTPVSDYLRMLVENDGHLFNNDSTAWRLQPLDSVSRFNASYYCTIFAVGFNFDDGMILVRFRVCGDQSLGALQSPMESQLVLEDDGEAGQDCDTEGSFFVRADYSSEIIGTIRFEADYETLTADVPPGHLYFRYGSDGYSRAPIFLPGRTDTGNNATFAAVLDDVDAVSAARAIEAEENARITPKSFEEYCRNLEERSKFLLKFRPSSSVAEMETDDVARSKYSLVKILDVATVNGIHSGRASRHRSDDGDNRWKQVIEFLRVHSKIRKQHSSESLRLTSPTYSERQLSVEGTPTQIGISRQHSMSAAALSAVDEEFFLRDADSEDNSYSVSPAQASMQAAALFILGDTINVSTESLGSILERRNDRAKSRIVGFQSLTTAISLPSAVDDFFSVEEILLFVRSSLQSSINLKPSSPGGSVTAIQGLLGKDRIHYLTNLEGCCSEVSDSVQEAFLSFSSRVAQLLSRYIENWEGLQHHVSEGKEAPARNIHLSLNGLNMMLSLWSMHFSSRDHKFLFHCGLLPALYRLVSLSSYERAAQVWSSAASTLAGFIQQHSAYTPSKMIPWKSWSEAYVDDGLRSSTLSCRHILFQLAVIPSYLVSDETKRQHGLSVPYHTLVEKFGCSETSFLFHKVTGILRMDRERAEMAKEKEIEALECSKLEKIGRIQEVSSRCGKFESTYCGNGITLSAHGVHASVTAGLSSHDPVCVMANVLYDLSSDLTESGNYFEVEILVLGRGDIGVGLCNHNVLQLRGRMPGWDPAGSYAYHGDDGKKFGPGATPGDWTQWAAGDIIGCGIDPVRRAIFYTRNGVLLGDAFLNVSEAKLWPVVGFANQNRTPEKVAINFGVIPFAYKGPQVMIMVKALQEQVSVSATLDDVQTLTASMARLSSSPVANIGEASFSESTGDCQIVLSPAEIVLQLERHQSAFDSANAFLYELTSLRNLASAILVFLLVVTRLSEDESSSNPAFISSNAGVIPPTEANSSVEATASSPTKLLKGISVFGTPKHITSTDGRSLQEAICSAFIQEIIIGSDYLLQFRKDYTDDNVVTVVNRPPPVRSGTTITDIQKSNLETGSGTAHSSSGFDDRRLVVEASEVESVLYEHLNSVHSIITCTPMLVEGMSGCQVLRALLNLLLVGSPRIVLIAYKVLYCCLPSVTPEEAERAVCHAWRARLEAAGAVEIEGRRKRRMPTAILRLLLAEVERALPFTGTKAGKVSEHCCFGYGDGLMLVAEQSICLIQKLFETPAWTEVASAVITDIFRDALVAVDALQVQCHMSVQVEAAAQLQCISHASAALAMFAGFNCFRPGARVRSFNGPCEGAEGYLISTDEIDQNAKVVFVQKPMVESLDKVETISIDCISVICEGVKVDMSRLSQPLLPQLISLIKATLNFAGTLKEKSHLELSCHESIILLLAAQSAVALSALMETASDQLIECLIELDLVADIVKLSLLPSGLPAFVGADTVTRMWSFSHARLIECRKLWPSTEDNIAQTCDSSDHDDPASAYCANMPCDAEMGVVLSSSLGGSPATASEYSEFRAESQLLSSELNLAEDACFRRLQYFHGNVGAARSSLLLETGETDEFEDGCATQHPLAAVAINNSDGHLLTSIEGSEGKGEAASWYCNAAETSKFCFDSFPSLTGDPLQKANLFSEEMLDYIAETDVEDNASHAGGRVGGCFDSSIGSEELLAGFHNKRLGITLFETVSTASIKKITSFYDCNPRDVQKLSNKLNFSVAILRVREIATKMLMEGTFNLIKDAGKLSDWLLLMKLASASSNASSTASVDGSKLAAMATALLRRAAVKPITPPILEQIPPDVLDTAVGHPVPFGPLDNQISGLTEKIAQLIVNDLEEEILALSESRKLRTFRDRGSLAGGTHSPTFCKQTKNTICSEPMYYASPHPFTSPADVFGEIVLPSSWRGTLVTFNPKCATPSRDSKLCFYTTKTDMDNDIPLHTFYGPSSNFIHVSFPSGTPSIFYRFSSAAYGNRLPLELRSKYGVVVANDIKGKAVVCKVSSAPVGLGDDDTLANLFGMGENVTTLTDLMDEPESTVVVSQMSNLTSGLWYLEVTVRRNDCAANIRTLLVSRGSTLPDLESCINAQVACQLDKNRIGIVSDRFDCSTAHLGAGVGGCCLSAGGAIYCQYDVVGTAEKVDQCDLLGNWTENDVIGVLFARDETSLKVSFSKNGKWGPTSCLEVDGLSGSKPAFELSGLVHFEVNFGEHDFKYFPSLETSHALMLGQPVMSADAVQHTVIRSVIDRPLADNLRDMTWGYSFKIQELTDLSVSVARTFDVIWSRDSDDKSEKEGPCTIWRPKPNGEFLSCGDIIVSSKQIPLGALLVDRRHCQPAKSFSKVFSTDSKLFIWRPVPPTGYVAMGDWATTTSTNPSTDTCMCLPLWAVSQCTLDKRVFTSRKAMSIGGKDKNCAAAIWTTSSGLGTFVANPTESLRGEISKTETDVDVVVYGYTLKEHQSIISIMAGEWIREDVVSTHGSLSWCNCILRNALNHPMTRKYAVTTAMFTLLVNYLKSSLAPNPFKAVDMLVQLIRSAYCSNYALVTLPISELDSLCKSVLAKAVSKKDKGGLLSDQLFALVDLVVEVIIVQFADGSDGDGTIRNSSAAQSSKHSSEGVLRGFPSVGCAKEFTEPVVDSNEGVFSDDKAISAGILNSPESCNWWEHRRIPAYLVNSARMLALKKLEPIFLKDPPLRKLKYAIKFFTALESLRNDAKLKRVMFPKRMICKLWFDYISGCICDESSHPYNEDTTYHRTICVPGADKMVITFDKRCSLGPGATLTLRNDEESCVFSSSTLTWTTHTFLGDTVIVDFVVGLQRGRELRSPQAEPSNTVRDDTAESQFLGGPEKAIPISEEHAAEPANEPVRIGEEWGWSIIVNAMGPIFECSTTHCPATVNQAWINSELASVDDIIISASCTDELFPVKLETEASATVTGVGSSNNQLSSVSEVSFQQSPLIRSSSFSESPGATSSVPFSTELVAATEYDVRKTDSRLPPRPLSRSQSRGDCGAKRNAVVDSSDLIAVTEIFKKVGGDLNDQNEMLVLRLVVSRGLEIQTGTLSVPYATELDITVIPKLLAAHQAPVVHVLRLMCASTAGKKWQGCIIDILYEGRV